MPAMDAPFDLADGFGPAKVLHVTERRTGLRGILVVDNVARGPAIGGLRMAPDVSLAECFRLARAMTFKNAAAGLAHGGGKSVVFADPRMPPPDKEALLRAFADAIRETTDYIVGPDMGTDEGCMAWMHDETGRAVGLPAELGGIPLDEIGATGFGLASASDVAREYCGHELDGARVVVQGFGAVGRHAARFLAKRGAVLVAAADSQGTVVDDDGLDVAALAAHKAEGGSFADYEGAERRERDAVLDVPCDIWIPAARPDVLTADTVGRLDARLVAQGANVPATPEAEAELHRRGILSIPDFIANAGGVICAAVEYRGGTARLAFETIDEKIRANTREVLEQSRAQRTEPRQAARAMAEARVRAAMNYRRFT